MCILSLRLATLIPSTFSTLLHMKQALDAAQCYDEIYMTVITLSLTASGNDFGQTLPTELSISELRENI